MPKPTIKDAVIAVLLKIGKPSSVKEIFEKIIEWDFYRFKAERPVGIVAVEVRRHCMGVEFPTAKAEKYYQILNDGTYWLLDKPIPGLLQKDESNLENADTSSNQLSYAEELKNQHNQYLEHFKNSMLDQIKDASPRAFETFSKNFLKAYGFKDLKVTPYSKDGGVDGYGRLKIGISFLDVAFQSKRWKTKSVSQGDIQTFRGSISGKCEQGIFFTTSTYTKAAKDVGIQKGAVPIILIDGNMIVDIMIDKKFGIEIDANLPLYFSSLDSAFTEEA